MNIQNKTVIFLDSSVTHGSGNFSMCNVIAEQTGANVIKWAVSGTILSTAREIIYEVAPLALTVLRLIV